MEQTPASCPASGQAAAGTWLPSNTQGATMPPSDTATRFHGDGVRFKAKLIGVDLVPDTHGHKTCWDSMMKLKGMEAAARKQGKHKQRVWLKVSSSGVKIVDERTGAVQHDHERGRISSLTKDESDPRALAYVYQQQESYSLFYIKMTNLAAPVLDHIKEVCERVDQQKPQDATETPAQNSSLVLLNESSASPLEASASEDLFSPQTDSSSGQTKESSSSSELKEVFSIQLEQPLTPTQSSCTSEPVPPESSLPTLSNSQILSMFPTQRVGGFPYSSPPYSPTTMPWSQQGPPGNQWPGPAVAGPAVAGPAVAPWPNVPGNMAAWAPAGVAAPAASSQIHSSQPGALMTGHSVNHPAGL